MSAVIHYLDKTSTEDQPRGASRPALDHPVALEFRAGVIDRLVQILEDLMASADTDLLGDSSLAQDGRVTPAYFDVAFIARADGPRLTRAYARAISDGFRPLSTAGRVAAPGSGIDAAVDQASAIAHLERDYRREFGDLQGLLGRLVREQDFPVAPDAVQPPKLIGAFAAAIGNCEVAAEAQAPLMRLYEQALLRGLGELLGWAFEMLSEREVERFDEPAEQGEESDAIGSLEQLASAADGSLLPGDMRLASELLQIARDDAHPSAAAVRTMLTLTSEWLDTLCKARLTVPGLRSQFQAIRFPLIKSALTDPSLFLNPAHPVRTLLDELAVLAGMARITGAGGEHKARQLAQEVLMQFDLSPDFVTGSLTGACAPDEPSAQAFRDSIRAEAEERERMLADKIRVHAREYMEQVTLAVQFPAAVTAFLEHDWLPALAAVIEQHGCESRHHASLDELLGQLEAHFEPGLDAGINLSALAQALRRQFDKASHENEAVHARLEAAVDAIFDESVDEPAPSAAAVDADTPAPSPEAEPGPEDACSAAAASPDLIEMLMAVCTPGAWFRVHDHQRGVSRWMKFESMDPAEDAIRFSEFDGSSEQRISLAGFTADLLAMRSEPINAAPNAQDKLNRLIDAKFA